MSTFSNDEMRQMANAIRFLSIDAVQKANSGHPGMPLGAADVMTALFSSVIKINPRDPEWQDRDRFVLSAGHGSSMQYAAFHLMGYEDFSIDEIKNFRQLNAKTAGHPEYGHARGIDATTGPLGQGIGMAVGMALSEAMLRERLGAEYCDHHTYVVVGDGCMMEGISQEALELAGHLKLGRLIALFDDNSITIDGCTGIAGTVDMRKRVEAAGWEYAAVDGHNPEAVAAAVLAAKKTDKPSFIACKTTIGYGAHEKAGTSGCHGAVLGADILARMRESFPWPHAAFEVPGEIRTLWNKAAARSAEGYAEWQTRFAAMPAAVRTQWDSHFTFKPAGCDAALLALKKTLASEKPEMATRMAGQKILDAIAADTPCLLGGSADLTPACLTLGKGVQAVTPDDKKGNYIHYGVREHGMAAVMNGISLHKGFLPFGSTFFCFTDYEKPAIRLAALMRIPAIHVLTHDSISVGEDGPTHQPIEHLAAFRALPNCLVMRPGDSVETVECWQIALGTRDKPILLVLSRLPLATQCDYRDGNPCRQGAYVLAEAKKSRAATIIATGSEVQIAIKARELLAAKGIDAAVVSMPCWELFDAQDKKYRTDVLGSAPIFAVEAGASLGWERYTGCSDRVFAIDSFGISAPPAQVYAALGLTPEKVAEKIQAAL